VLNEVLVLQILILGTLLFFINSINIITLWYLAGIYLISLGLLLLLDDGNILIGFLWIIDLGVGLIFFIFILHFSNFLYQKSVIELSNRYFFIATFLLLFALCFFFYMVNPVDANFNFELRKIWFFFVSWYDYYDLYNSYLITELNLLREMYFYNNSLGFLIINFMLFYGIFGAINLCFSIKLVFSFMSLSQIKHHKLLSCINTSFFIRNQNFIKQQNTSAGTRVWVKNKNFNL
jgi:hypothetical protein